MTVTWFRLVLEKHYEGCGICHLIHIFIFCLNYLMHYLCMMQSVNLYCVGADVKPCSINQSINQSIKRVLSFISKCVNSDCDLVSFSARHTVLYGSMSSPLGRSALCCSLRYMFDIECLLYPQFNNCSVVRNFYLSTRSAELLVKVDVLMMMMMIMN